MRTIFLKKYHGCSPSSAALPASAGFRVGEQQTTPPPPSAEAGTSPYESCYATDWLNCLTLGGPGLGEATCIVSRAGPLISGLRPVTPQRRSCGQGAGDCFYIEDASEACSLGGCCIPNAAPDCAAAQLRGTEAACTSAGEDKPLCLGVCGRSKGVGWGRRGCARGRLHLRGRGLDE
eukprot:COSAG04_NODE_9062_length_902_cov_1.905355_1_plen_177_part_00